MRISKIEVRNYRAIAHGEMLISPVTAILGENNSGKSSFLAAIKLFFAAAPKIEIDDFHRQNVTEPIEVTLSFSDLTPQEEAEFGSKVANGTLVVTRRLTVSKSREYLVSGLANPQFKSVREIEKKSDKLKEYNRIRDDFGLPKITRSEDCEEALSDWEIENPRQCDFQKISGFFGAENVANGKLQQKTAFIFVPAIKQVREDLDTKSSPVKELLSGIARQAIENNKEFQEFVEESKARIAELTSPQSVASLGEISGDLTQIVKRYYEEAELEATWDEVSSLPIDLPTPDVLVSDGMYQTRVDYVGHGMQRAIILTLLEYISEANQREVGEYDRAQSDIIIAIEEPELFQHPTKQRLFYTALSELASDFNRRTGIRLQVMYATHSPLLVSLADVDRVRVVRKQLKEDVISVSVSSTSLEKCAKIVADIRGFKPIAERYGVGLHVVTSDIAEAFFAKAVVLVEGISDVAILEAAYRQKGRDVLSEGIAIKSVGGKRNLDRPCLVFREFNIPTFVIMDNDQHLEGSDKEKGEVLWNRFIQDLCGVQEPSGWPDAISDRFASWNGTVEDYIRSEAGDELYNNAIIEMSKNFSISGKDCVKSPAVAGAILSRLASKGVTFSKFDRIIEAVDALKA